jgi:cold shock CspA family protein
MSRCNAIVKWLDSANGYGFLGQDGDRDVFVQRQLNPAGRLQDAEGRRESRVRCG